MRVLSVSRRLAVAATLGLETTTGLSHPEDASYPTLCAVYREDGERLACFDRWLVERHGDRTPAETEPGRPQRFSPDEPVADERYAHFGKPARAPNQEPEVPMVALVNRLGRSTLEKLVIHLANGQVWKQTDTRVVFLREGHQVSIRRAPSGGYLLELASGGRSIPVRRVR